MKVGLAAAAALALYVGAVLALTWPLGAHLGTHLADTAPACRFDPPYMAWILAHETRVLAGGPGRFTDPNAFYPARGTLFYGDTGFGPLALFAPVFLATGNPTLALNVVLLGGLALTAWALHLVVVRWTGSALAGFLAAWTLLTSRWMLRDFTPSAPTYAVLPYFPVIMLLAARPARRLGEALHMVPWIVLQCLSDVVYVATAVFAPLGVLGLGRLVRRTTRAAGGRLLLALGLAVVVLLPVYLAHLAVWWGDPRLISAWNAVVFPPALPWGPFTSGPLAVPFAVWAVIGAGAASVVIARLRGGEVRAPQAWWHGVFWLLVGLYLSLPPVVTWQGTPLSLPHAGIANRLGLYQVLRIPTRLGIAGLMGLAILTGIAAAECLRRLSRRAGPGGAIVATVIVAAAMYRGYARGLPGGLGGAYPLMATVSGDTTIVRVLREGHGPVVEVPIGRLGPCGRPDLQVRAMYRSIFHGRPVLNGYNSYLPGGFTDRVELIRHLVEPDALAALRRKTGVTAIVVRLRDFDLPDQDFYPWYPKREREEHLAERARWLALAEPGVSPDLHLVVRDGDELLFEVAEATADPATITQK